MSASTPRFRALTGWRYPRTQPSLPESHGSVAVPRAAPFWRKMLAFAGPGYLVAVGYMDPGNWATDLAGGARFGYTLLSVIMISNLMAILLQALAPEARHRQRPRPGAGLPRPLLAGRSSFVLWVLCEIAIAACDLAEVIGAAIALNLLFGLPLIWGVCSPRSTCCSSCCLQNRGFRYVEALVVALIAARSPVCFAVELAWRSRTLAASPRGLVPDARDRLPIPRCSTSRSASSARR